MTSTRPRFCGNPSCKKEPLEGRFVCDEHAGEMDRIKKELEEDPRLLYHQRSDNPNRRFTEPSGKVATKKAPTVPTCKVLGCFQERVPPDIYCDQHMNYEE